MRYIAAVSLVSLIIYQILCVFKILNKVELVEKFWKQIFPNKRFCERIVRMIFLHISLITYLFSANILINVKVFNIIILFTPILALLASLSSIRKK